MAINANQLKEMATNRIIALSPSYFNFIPQTCYTFFNHSVSRGATMSLLTDQGSTAKIDPADYTSNTNVSTTVNATARYLQATFPLTWSQLQDGVDPSSAIDALLPQLEKGIFQVIVDTVATVSTDKKTVDGLGDVEGLLKGTNKTIFFGSNLRPSTINTDANALKKNVENNRLETGAYGFHFAQQIDDQITSSTGAVGNLDYIAWSRQGIALGMATPHPIDSANFSMVKISPYLPDLLLNVYVDNATRNVMMSLETIIGVAKLKAGSISYGTKTV